jgi:hypothetical protein
MWKSDEPFGSTIFCDDIRQEVGGKLSYMGVYYGAVYVPSFPISIPKFAVSVTFYEPIELTRKRTWVVPVRLFIPGQEGPVATGEIPVASEEPISAVLRSTLPPDPDVPPLMIAQLAFAMTPLVMGEPGRLKVRGYYREDMIITMGSLRVEQSPETTAAPAADR